MSEILVVAQNGIGEGSFVRELSDLSNCNVRTTPDSDLPSRHILNSPPDLLIVDLQSLSRPARQVFASLGTAYPEASVIVLVPSKDDAAVDELGKLGIDEIVVHPGDASGHPRSLDRILQWIAARGSMQELQDRLRREVGQGLLVAKSRSVRSVIERLPKLAESNSTVLICGETGTGKELFARAIHYLGPRSGKPFVTVDCASIPEHLVENELFGHVRGAYTDAGSPVGGLIQEANAGTLFLDEVEAMPLAIQSKFLRFLQERQYRPIGQARYISVDVRILAATNIDLSKAVQRKEFREDLYYRLNVVPLSIPPLRERKSDIPALLNFFARKYCTNPQDPPPIPAEVFSGCMECDWPGNVRELENKIQQWLMDPKSTPWSNGAGSGVSHGGPVRPLSEVRGDAIARAEQEYLHGLLARTHGNLSAAARMARINRKTLSGLLKKHDIRASHYRR